MKRTLVPFALAAALVLSLTACGENPDSSADSVPSVSGAQSNGVQVAGSADMAAPVEMDLEGLTPVYASSLNNGVYDITVDSSSSMFKIVSCRLTVEDGGMTAVMTMSGTGYLYVYMGTGEQAAAAGEDSYIPFVEDESGAHTYTVPVEALNTGIDCAAFSKNKEMWYDRTLIFRADSLPMDAFADGVIATAESLGLADGSYTVDVKLSGGSGRASVESPTLLTVENGAAKAVNADLKL